MTCSEIGRDIFILAVVFSLRHREEVIETHTKCCIETEKKNWPTLIYMTASNFNDFVLGLYASKYNLFGHSGSRKANT